MINIRFLENLAKNKYLTLSYEDFLTLHYSKFLKEGDVVLDIGANEGEHTVNFLSLVGKDGIVMAFEPLPEMYQKLTYRFKSNSNFYCFEIALGSENKTSTFVKAKHLSGHLAESGIKERVYNDPDNMTLEEINVSVMTLDHLNVKKKIDYIKIDTEGGEIDILNGANELINRDRPIISVEYGKPSYSVYGYEANTLWDLAKSLNYEVYDIFLNEIKTIDDWSSVCNTMYWDYILVPTEKNESFKNTMKS
jgi:FkbM family methyltransferase